MYTLLNIVFGYYYVIVTIHINCSIVIGFIDRMGVYCILLYILLLFLLLLSLLCLCRFIILLLLLLFFC